MPTDRLSEQDRLRLAELLRAPLIPPSASARPPKKPFQWRAAREMWSEAKSQIKARWSAVSVETVKSHFLAHQREWAARAGAMLLCLLVVGTAVKLESGLGPGSLRLQALDRGGHLQIRWNAGSDVIRQATGAKLFITDGDERLYVTLDGFRLRRGEVRYARQTDRVELRMAVAEANGRLVEEQATFVGVRTPDRDEFQAEAKARPAGPVMRPSGDVSAAEPPKPLLSTEHRSRRKPVVQSGADLPFTCYAGDTFHKTNAPAGWDTFTCRGKNVWSNWRAQPRENRSIHPPSPNATTLTAKPASASTT
jgi:hypothetical protein